MELRPYQIQAIQSLRAAVSAGNKRVMLYSPTGSGKTECALAILRGAANKGKRALFVANRIELVGQASRRFGEAGLEHGVIQSSNTRGTGLPLQVCSIQTLKARGFPEGVDLVVIDEAHAVGGTEAYRELMMAVHPAPVIGLSATPFTAGLAKTYDDLGGPLFQELVVASTIRDLINEGFLVDVDIYAPSEPDLEGVAIAAGDYNKKQLAERVEKPKLVGDVVDHWFKLAGGKQTVCFATSIAHSKMITDAFEQRDIPAGHIDAYTDDEDRRTILGRFARGEIRVLSNVSVLAEGWDCPSVEVMILARPTRSLTRFIQMVGRVLRPAPGKAKALMLDHSGSTRRLGFPTDDLPLELDDGKPKSADEKKCEEKEREQALPKVCPACHYMKPAGVHKCPRCGFEPFKPVLVARGELQKLERGTMASTAVEALKPNASREEKQALYSQLLQIQADHGYKDGWVAHKYKRMFGVWPKGLDRIAERPQNWVIRWAMNQRRA